MDCETDPGFRALTEKLTRPLNILVVDDDSNFRYTLKVQIDSIVSSHSRSVVVIEADSGEHALVELGLRKFDLIFLDMKLSAMSGLDVLEKVKHLKLNVVIVTGLGSLEDLQRCKDLGAFLVILKPFTEDDIRKALHFVTSTLGPDGTTG